MKKLLCLMLLLGFTASAQAQNFENVTPQQSPAAAATTPTAKVCQDDARLLELGTLLENPAKISPSLTMTAETFLSLDQEVIKALGGKLIICPNNPVLKNGKPLKKLALKPDTLMQLINEKVRAGDFEGVKQISLTYVIAPIQQNEIASLLTPLPYDGEVLTNTLKALGMSPNFDDDGSDAERKVNLEVIAALKGKVAQFGDVYITAYPLNEKVKQKLPKNAFYLDNVVLFVNLNYSYKQNNEKAVRLLRAIGLNPMIIPEK